jgi:PAS domain S-box-containing protein
MGIFLATFLEERGERAMTIRRNLLGSFLLVLLLPAIGVGIVSYYVSRESLRNSILANLTLLAESRGAEILQYIQHKKGRAVDFAAGSYIVGEMERLSSVKKTVERKKIYRALSDHLVATKLPLDPDLFLIRIFDISGRIAASTERGEAGRMNEKGKSYFLKGLKGTYIDVLPWHVHKTGIAHRGLAVATPIKDGKGRAIGVLVNGYDLGAIRKILSGEMAKDLGARSIAQGKPNMYILEGDGHVLASIPEMPEKVPMEPGWGRPPSAETRGEWRNLKGEKVWGASTFMRIEGDRTWALIIEEKKDAAMHPIIKIARLWAVSGIVLLAAILVLAVRLSNSPARPIHELENGARIIGGGNLEYRVGTGKQDETGRLSRAFDDMAGKLDFSLNSIEAEIAEHKRAEEHLRRLTAIIEATSDLVSVFELPGRLVYLNRAGRHLLGIGDREDLENVRMEDIYPAWARKIVFDEGIPEAMNKGLWEGEAAFLSRAGKEVPVSCVIIAHRQNGKMQCLSAIARDITEQKWIQSEILGLNEELRLHAERVEAANRDLESFAYSVSHDLRAPLRAVDRFSLALFEEHAKGLDSQGKRLLQMVRQNTAIMGQLIEDILAFSRAGRKEAEYSRVPMDGIAKQICDEIRESANGREISFSIAPLPPAVGDPSMIKQVLFNLISNAVKFTGRNGAALIEIGASGGEGENTYFVRDNGVGFDMRYKESLFGMFQRLHSTEEFEGTGIGLAIVRRIVEKHGGRVWAEGKVGEGAVFYFTLPNTKKSLGLEKARRGVQA